MESILRFTGKDLQDITFDEWLASKPESLGPIAKQWFKVMKNIGPDVQDIFHDNYPIVCYENAPFAYVNVYSKHVNIGFFYGSELMDNKQILVGSGKRMRHIKVRPDESIDEMYIKKLIESAYLAIREKVFKTFENTSEPSELDKTFAYLNKIPNEGAQHLFDLLQNFDEDSSDEDMQAILDTMRATPFASNVNTVYRLYFPIVSHILFYRPNLATKLLHYLIGPLFVFGDNTVDLIKKSIHESMEYQIKQNPDFMTSEGKSWVVNLLPLLHEEIQEELDIREKELEE